MSYLQCDIEPDNKRTFRVANVPQYSAAHGFKETHEKPPLGLMPKKIYDYKRMVDIFDAMQRYSEAEKVIPIEWIDELKELVTLWMTGAKF